MPTIRETTFNTKLTEILRQKNPRWRQDDTAVAEAGAVLDGGGTPDILISPADALPIVVETEFLPARTVEDDAKKRLGRIVQPTGKEIKQVVALRVPQEIKQVAAARLEAEIAKSRFEYCIFSIDETDSPPVRWPQEKWLHGGVDELVALIENALISEQLIAKSLEVLDGGVTSAAARLLGAVNDESGVLSRLAELLHQTEGKQTTRMAMAIIANAMTFHGVLAGTKNVRSIDELRIPGTTVLTKGEVIKEWIHIVAEINYYPIFDIARGVLVMIPARVAAEILDVLSKVADQLIAFGITSSNDLYGRMFQRLITDRKFLATFYTLPESAMLLAEIAADKMKVDYTDEAAAPALRLADFACGTGTLLAAAYHAILARHRRAGHDDADIHKQMMEESLIATDIMPAGVHLTASILSSVHPAITFDDTKVHTLPYGGERLSLGALDLIEKQASRDLLQTRTRMGGRSQQELKGKDTGEMFALEHDSCDLVIMNPPFTRPTNHEITDKPVPSFAGFSTSEDEQRAMSSRLKKINAGLPDRAGHGNAGLASNFIDLAHQKLKPGGVLAMVLPAVFVSGKSWENSRRFVNANYDDITVVSLVSSGVNTDSFSADTAIAEVLLIGKKRENKRKTGDAGAKFVTLRKRPANAAQAGVVAGAIEESNNGIWAGGDCLGEVTYNNLIDGGVIGVQDNTVIKIAMALQKSTLSLPGVAKPYTLPITRLRDLAERGLLDRDINGKNSDGSARGPFDIEPKRDIPTYPCLWAHHADLERSFIVPPDTQGRERKGMREAVNKVLKTRSTLHFNRDFQLNSQSLAACVTPMPTIGGRAWPNVRPKNAKHEAAIVLWANSTLGLLLWWYFAVRPKAGRAILSISRQTNLPTLDTRRLTDKQHQLAARIFSRFKRKHFRAANEAYHDTVRHDLDRAVLVELLGLPESILEPLDLLRRKWCFEPSVHGGKKTRPIQV